MKGYEILGFLGILRECIKVISKNGKLIATITTISILLDSLLFFDKSYSGKSRISDLLTQETLLSLSNSNFTNVIDSFEHIKKDVQNIIGFESVYLLLCEAGSLFSLVIVILGSAVAYSDKNLSFEDFVSRIPKLCLRTLVTLFHRILFTTGYIVLFSALLMSLMIENMDNPLVVMPIVIPYGLFASIFGMYFSFLWDIALVISVIEKSCGLQALGKARGLVKGNRIQGLALFFSYAMVMVIISMSFRGNPNQKQVWKQIIYRFFAMVFSCTARMFYFMSCTVLYFQCKKMHGEEIELQGSLEYSRIRNDRGGANLKPVLVKLVIYLLLKVITYKLIFKSKSSDGNPMFERTLASGGS